MPNAPPRPCAGPHCGRFIRAGKLCPFCQRARDHQRGTATARGYDGDWAIVSRAWLARFPWCGQRRDGQLHADHSRCVQAGHRVRATVTDHIHALRDGGARLDEGNLQSLCRSCNAAKDRQHVSL